jgi:hypothetical protein
MFAAWRSFVAPEQAVYFSASPEVERFSRARRDISSDFARVADVDPDARHRWRAIGGPPQSYG